ncbi:AraC family transcriptional regulator [Mesorhizobium sp. M7A.F.Ca.US.001.04.1.1]|uniref:AraC family transcriptional regulator n=1 Tax=unclassified Mesorhizobium TaxID=325217 RepID=UPI000FCA7DEE|nr:MULTISPECIES: helix-turn-helix transcriptional regulator [unclassified Mesorhizobium]RUY27365.1 AraC family transcriptional regulator [Mesorhizobium sp. M7A.F.Ca.US.001.04.2.1]RUY39397.1 AraC family transcriptional regulator [Mesorhizobium sp. M7A.F.Ca.US.001.04.1.1]
METFKEVPRPVIALGIDYPDGHVTGPHHHRRAQLLYGLTGVVTVTTPNGAWMMPPQRGMWIPPGAVHDVRMLGQVQMRSLYLEPASTMGMPEQCQVVGISSLMRGLLAEAVTIPTEYETDSRAGALMTLILHEIRVLPPLPLALPLPSHDALARLCRRFIMQPSPHDTIDEWSRALRVSRRTFTRLFRRETGLSFVLWRQQACVMAALPRLAAGEAVTTVAIDLGYDNPAAFTSMFKRILGTAPREYFSDQR